MKLILLLAFLASCSTTVPHIPVEKSPEVAVGVLAPKEVVSEPNVLVVRPTPTLPAPKPIPPKRTRIAIKELKGFSPTAEARFRKVVTNVEVVINSEEFKKLITEHKYENKSQFVDTPDAPNLVYEKITGSDWVLEYRMEKLFSGSTIGYTLPSVTWIVFNSKFWNKLNDSEVAANICHEYGGHKLGRYGHAKKWNKARDFSAPYGIGEACDKTYKVMFK